MALTQAGLNRTISQNSTLGEDVDLDAPLFSSGALDSVAMLNLIMFIEQETGMDIRAEDVTLDNFDTPARILNFTRELIA